jgi:molybdopterin biosynthesis enzyme
MDHLTYFFQGILDVDCSGRQVVFVIENQQSFKVGPGLQANCWVRVDHGCSGLDAGAMVEVYPYNNTLKEF